jgi:anti-sigma B factor antagonist
MKIDEERRGSMTVVRPQGALVGADADSLHAHLARAAESNSCGIVLDASTVAFVDSRGLEVLADATENLIRNGRTLKLAGANPTLREVLELTELAPMFEQFDDVDAAVEASE